MRNNRERIGSNRFNAVANEYLRQWEQPSNAESPKLVTLFGMETFVSEVQLPNAVH